MILHLPPNWAQILFSMALECRNLSISETTRGGRVLTYLCKDGLSRKSFAKCVRHHSLRPSTVPCSESPSNVPFSHLNIYTCARNYSGVSRPPSTNHMNMKIKIHPTTTKSFLDASSDLTLLRHSMVFSPQLRIGSA